MRLFLKEEASFGAFEPTIEKTLDLRNHDVRITGDVTLAPGANVIFGYSNVVVDDGVTFEIGEGAEIENSTVRGPVSIAENCLVKDSYVGPFTSVGKGTTIDTSSVEHSVILENCQIISIERLADSIIGNEVKLTKGDQNFKALKLFIGDDARIEI